MVPNEAGLLKDLDHSDLDARAVALVSAPLNQALDGTPLTAVPEQARIRQYTPNQIELNVEASGRALLVLSELFYPGWTASVNGKSAPVWKVDGALRAIVVPRGRSTVALHYAPRSVYAGAMISLACFALGLGV